MTAEDVETCNLTDLIHEAHRHPGSKPLATRLSRARDLYHRKEGNWHAVTLNATHLRGWLARHLAEPAPVVEAHAVPFAGCVPGEVTT